MFTAIVDAYWRFREAWGFASIENHWRDAGVASPTLIAVHELCLRAELERFRDWASDAYVLHDVSLVDAKREFIARLSPFMDQADRVTLAKVVAEMDGDEAFHSEALAKHRARGRDLFAAARADAKVLRKSGALARHRRVLRGA